MENLGKKNLVDESLIFPNLEVNSKEEVIELLGKKLEEKGYVTDEFVRKALEREEIFSTGLPFKIPVALPHTDAKYCNRSALAIGILKHPVIFKEMGDPQKELQVKIVFLLALDDPKSQVKWLQLLIKTFQNNELLERLSVCQKSDKIAKFLKETLN